MTKSDLERERKQVIAIKKKPDAPVFLFLEGANMEKRFLEKLKHWNISEKDHIYLGASGGGDSQALLLLLLSAQKEIPFQLSLLHVHHGLRNTADRDEAFVRAFAEKHHLSLRIFHGDVANLAKEEGLSIEEAARDFRCALFLEVLEENERNKVFLAHHKQDQAETVLMRMVRGSGIPGLTGMTPIRGRFYRPLLETSKEELLSYLKEKGESFCYDETNDSDFALRNKLRHHIFPYLESINPKVVENLCRLSVNAKEMWALIQEIMEEEKKRGVQDIFGWTFQRRRFLDFSSAKAHAFLHGLLHEKLFKGISREQILFWEELIRRGEGENSHGKMQLYVNRDSYFIGEKCDYPPYEVSLEKKNVEIPFSSLILWVKSSNIEEMRSFPPNEHRIYADKDKLEKFTLRNRRKGDVFSPFGFSGTKKLKDFFIDEKIPYWKRDAIPLLCSGKEILWIPGYRRSDKALVDEETKEIVCVEERR